MQGILRNWTETSLYEQIRQSADRDEANAAAKHTLDHNMPTIQQLLQQSETAPTDFTLHDAQHGFRVAQRMVEIVGDTFTHLSGYELALLLLSAYLHDIGMTPKQQRVRGLYRYLLTKDPGDLNTKEIEHFELWLDLHGEDATPPLAQRELTGKTIGEVESLVAYYCRERHNDWSAEWIETHLVDQTLGEYREWVSDLIALCKSHHDGFDELLDQQFDPVDVGATVVHRRYLAAVLRLADVMDIDPERTPEVVLRQRDVDPSSLIYWWKDQGTSIKLENNRYCLVARPRSALFHKAVLDTGRQIEQELTDCRRLAEQTDFGRMPGSALRLPYSWDLSATLGRRISPLGDYDYIDGTFRPDVGRVLKLLSGVALYGDELAAVRELLQNAFDAVRERIARERLAHPTDPNRPALLANLHMVTLQLVHESEGYWLVCHDSGAGMTKDIIRDHLLVSGANRRDDLLRLQRRCEAADFRLERTAHFGIGVLSYFMICDQVHIRTRRCQVEGQGENTGWSFITDALSGFGELRRDPGYTDGTQVRLRLKKDLIGDDPSTLWQRIVTYVKKALTQVPCRLRVSCSTLPEFDWSVDTAGWVREPSSYAEQSLSVLTPNVSSPTKFADMADDLADLVPGERITAWRQAKETAQSLHDKAHGCMRWSAPILGELPNGLGQYRFFFPRFELEGGSCLHFFDVEDIDGAMVAKPCISSGYPALAPWCPVLVSWFGVAADHGLDWLKRYRFPGVIEIDWTSEAAGTIEVNRNRILLSEEAERAIGIVVANLKTAMRDFAEKTQSRFALYNCALTDGLPPPAESWNWLCQHEQERRVEWRRLSFPLIAPLSRDDSAIMQISSYRWLKQAIPRYCGVSGSTQPPHELPQSIDGFTQGHRTHATWYSSRLAPDRVVTMIDPYRSPFGDPVGYGFAMLWEQAPMAQDPRTAHPEAQFPPDWASLCLVLDPPQVIWNRDHRLVRAVSRQAWKTLMKSPCKGGDPRPFASELIADSGLAAAWILFCLSGDHRDLLMGVAEHSTELFQRIWCRAFGAEPPDQVWAYIDDYYGRRLVSVGLQGWSDVEQNSQNAAVYSEHFPLPGDEWRVVGVDRDLDGR